MSQVQILVNTKSWVGMDDIALEAFKFDILHQRLNGNQVVPAKHPFRPFGLHQRHRNCGLAASTLTFGLQWLCLMSQFNITKS
jgi:hypothetical protein